MLAKKKSPGVIAESIAQDFNDIFTVIAGLAELASTEAHVRGDAKLARYLQEIHKSGQRGSELLHQCSIDGSDSGDSDTAKR